MVLQLSPPAPGVGRLCWLAPGLWPSLHCSGGTPGVDMFVRLPPPSRLGSGCPPQTGSHVWADGHPGESDAQLSSACSRASPMPTSSPCSPPVLLTAPSLAEGGLLLGSDCSHLHLWPQDRHAAIQTVWCLLLEQSPCEDSLTPSGSGLLHWGTVHIWGW